MSRVKAAKIHYFELEPYKGERKSRFQMQRYVAQSRGLIIRPCLNIETGSQTELHCQVIAGNLEKVEQLVLNGADINAPDEIGETPLQDACRGFWGNVSVPEREQKMAEPDFDILAWHKIALILIKNGAFMSYDCLHLAIKFGETETARILFEKGIKVSYPSHSVFFAAHLPAPENRTMLELLRDNGVNLKAKCEFNCICGSKNSPTALKLCKLANREKPAQILRELLQEQ